MVHRRVARLESLLQAGEKKIHPARPLNTGRSAMASRPPGHRRMSSSRPPRAAAKRSANRFAATLKDQFLSSADDDSDSDEQPRPKRRATAAGGKAKPSRGGDSDGDNSYVESGASDGGSSSEGDDSDWDGESEEDEEPRPRVVPAEEQPECVPPEDTSPEACPSSRW